MSVDGLESKFVISLELVFTFSSGQVLKEPNLV